MILILFIIMIVFGLILLGIGLTQESFPAAYLGVFVFILMGLFLLSDGLEIPNGQTIDTTVTPYIVVDTYESYTAANNVFVSLLGNFFFYGAFGATILTTVFAMRSNENEYDDFAFGR